MSETYKNVEMQVLGETGYETIYPVPAGHKESHISGNDRITPADIGAQEAIVGTEGQTVVIGSNGKPTVANGVGAVVEQHHNLPQKFWRGTQSEYDAIETKDDNTMYIITDASGEPIQYGDMLKSDYDPQNRKTDIFKYVDEHATNIPITDNPADDVNIWIDPKEEGDGVGGSSIAIQPEQPTDGSEIWIDTDDESGAGGTSSGSGIYVGNEEPTGDEQVWVDMDDEEGSYYTKEEVNALVNNIGTKFYSKNTVASVYHSDITVGTLTVPAGTYIVNTYVRSSISVESSKDTSTLSNLISISGTDNYIILGAGYGAKGTMQAGGGVTNMAWLNCEQEATITLTSYGYHNATYDFIGEILAIRLGV